MPKVDGIVTIKVAPDKMSAEAFIDHPEEGGKSVVIFDLYKSIEEAGIVHGVEAEEKLLSLLEQGKIEPVSFIVAVGTPTGHGKDAKIEYAFVKGPEIKEAAIGQQQEDSVDFSQLEKAETKFVAKGDVIARKIPPTRGKEGKNIVGETTPGECGMEITLKAGGNVEMSADSLTYTALIEGAPVILKNEIRVDPIYIVRGDVNQTTGNVNFPGSLDIKGSITDGFIVMAGGNIIVNGNIQAATVICDGDLIVKGDILCRKEGKVSVKGKLVARFIEYSTIECQGDIIVERAIIGGKVICNGRIIVTSREGAIVGAEVMAQNEIRAKVLGSEKEIITILKTGYDYEIYGQYSKLEEEVTKINEELEKIRTILSSGKVSGDDLEKLRNTASELEKRKTGFQCKMVPLMSKLVSNPYAKIKGEIAIYPGCTLYVGNSVLKVSEKMKFATLDSRDRGLIISSYDELTGRIISKTIKEAGSIPSILVVDDAEFMRTKLISILSEEGYRIAGEAENGQEAIEKYKELKPDLVTMDITMPILEGIDALKAIKQINPKAKVLMVSALGQVDKVKESIVSGALDFVVTPFVPERIKETVKKAIEKKS